MIELYWPQAIFTVWLLYSLVFQSIDTVRGFRRARRRAMRRAARAAAAGKPVSPQFPTAHGLTSC